MNIEDVLDRLKLLAFKEKEAGHNGYYVALMTAISMLQVMR